MQPKSTNKTKQQNKSRSREKSKTECKRKVRMLFAMLSKRKGNKTMQNHQKNTKDSQNYKRSPNKARPPTKARLLVPLKISCENGEIP